MICRQAIHEQESLYPAAETLWRHARISMVRTCGQQTDISAGASSRLFSKAATQAKMRGQASHRTVLGRTYRSISVDRAKEV